MKTIGIEKLENGMSKTLYLSALLNEMTEKEIEVLQQIMELINGRPDRRRYAQNYTGKLMDLPEVLAAM